MLDTRVRRSTWQKRSYSGRYQSGCALTVGWVMQRRCTNVVMRGCRRKPFENRVQGRL